MYTEFALLGTQSVDFSRNGRDGYGTHLDTCEQTVAENHCVVIEGHIPVNLGVITKPSQDDR